MRERLRQASSAEIQSSPAAVAPASLTMATKPASSSTTLLEVISISKTAWLKIKGRSPVWILGTAALALITLVSTASYLIGAYRARTAVSSPQPTPANELPPLSTSFNPNQNIPVDPDKAIPLTSREFYGRGPETNRLYSFVAQPGLLKFTLNTMGAGVSVDAFNSEKKPLQFDYYDGLTAGSFDRVSEDLAQLKVDREQTILLRITSNLNQINPLQAFRLRIDGPAKLEEMKEPSPLAPIFASRLNPEPLISDTIFGGRGGKTASNYVLTAGPGDLTVQLNIIGSAASVKVAFDRYFDHDSFHLLRQELDQANPERMGDGILYMTFKDSKDSYYHSEVSGGFHEVNDEKVMHVELKKQMKLLMYVGIGNPDLLQAYRVKLSGPIQWAQPPQSAQPTDSNIDNLKSLFVPRDNPKPVTSGIISGSNPEKESYYSFTAGPGTVKVTLNLETTYGHMKIEFFSPDLKPVNFEPPGLELRLGEYKMTKREETMTLTFSREQRVLMRIISTTIGGASLRYRVKLDGAVKFQ
jgi:hypothetical protein